MMVNFFLFYLLLFSSVVAVSGTLSNAASSTLVPPNCFAGNWQLDVGKSDDLQRIKDKLLRKYQREQHAAYRAKPGSHHELDLSTGMPIFVFLTAPLSINIDEAEIVLVQDSVKRRVDASGRSQALSLKNLNNQGGATVAGWENKTLIIETTAMDGSRVKERYQLLADDHLLVAITLNTTVTKPVEMKKNYQRESKRSENCVIPENH